MLQNNGTTLNNTLYITEAFSKYFSSIAPELNSKRPHSNKNTNCYLKGNYLSSMTVPILAASDKEVVIKTNK